MAVTVVGVTGSIDAAEWPALARRMSAASGDELVTGMSVTPGTGRAVNVGAAGDCYQVGTLLRNSATLSVPIAAPPTGNPRIDTIVGQVDWFDAAGVPTTEATAGSIIAVAGQPNVTPVPFGLTKTAADLWRTAIAYVRVAPGATSFTANDITLASRGSQDARFAVRAGRAKTRQLIPASTWTTIQFDAVHHETNDFGGLSVNVGTTDQGLFVAPVAGTYQVSGRAHFVNQVGTANTRRQMRAINRTAGGTTRWVAYDSMRSAGDNWDHVKFDGTFDMLAGQTVELQVWHDETHSVYLSDNATTPTVGSMAGGDMSYGMMTLLAKD